MVGLTLVNTLLVALCFTGSLAWPFSQRQALTLPDVQKQALENAYRVLNGTLSDGLKNRPSSCNKDTVAVRKEYGDLSKDERLEYLRAVKCILKAPSKLPPGMYPGAKSRYDDFTVVHMNMTPTVHATANFMHWHRIYIFAYETALRSECNYKGYQPYWDWSKYPDIVNSPIFNGDQWSMGGNGDPIKHQGMQLGPNTVPGGPGGGCVTTGPLANLTIHLGPLASTVDPALGIKPNPRPADGFGDVRMLFSSRHQNPRCHRRDVNNYFTSKYMKPDNLLKHITSSSNILTFQNTLQDSNPSVSALHIGGHFSIWGDPGGDVFVSPNEPAFWLHHGQLDRHWWMWANYQQTEIAKRTVQYDGGTNWLNPNSAKGKPEDPQWLNIVAPSGLEGLAAKEMFSTTSGPFCYIYQ